MDRRFPSSPCETRSRARRARLRKVVVGIVLCCGCLSAGEACLSQASAQSYADSGAINREYPLKALFLFNFGSYVEWPAETFKAANEPFVISVLGTSAMDSTLREIARTKTIGGRRIEWKRFTNAADVTPCQILFVSRSVPAREYRQLIDSLRGKPTLIVGEVRNFGTDGGSINFFEEANKIRFEVNLQATKEQRLKISSKLLAMAKIVQTTSDSTSTR